MNIGVDKSGLAGMGEGRGAENQERGDVETGVPQTTHSTRPQL